MTQPSYNWPSREEWAKNKRTLFDDEYELRAWALERRFADIITEEERHAAIADLRRAVQEQQAIMRAERKAVRTGAATELAPRYQYAREATPAFRRMIEQLESRSIHFQAGVFAERMTPIPASVKAVVGKLRADSEACRAAHIAEKAKEPIDDAAWEAELKWRRRIETRQRFVSCGAEGGSGESE
jgi:hypothetical protein